MPSARKAGVRRCTGCAGFVIISIMLLMDPAVDAMGGWTTRTMYQRSCSAHLSVPVLMQSGKPPVVDSFANR